MIYDWKMFSDFQVNQLLIFRGVEKFHSSSKLHLMYEVLCDNMLMAKNVNETGMAHQSMDGLRIHVCQAEVQLES